MEIMEINLGVINTKDFVTTFGTQKLKERYNKDKRLGGKDKESLLKKANKYCEIQDLSRGKYVITKVYPMEKDDLVVPLKKGLNKFLTPLILSKLIELDCNNEFKYTLPFLGWVNKMDIINGENYNFIKYHQDKCHKSLNINPQTMEEFFIKVDLCIKYYLEKNLSILSDKSGLDLIDYETVQMVKKKCVEHKDNEKGGCDVNCKPPYDEPISDDDRKFYYECEKIAKERAGITRNQEKFYGTKSYIYRRELKVLLKKRNILFMYTSYNIFCKDVDEVINTLAKFNDIDTSPEEFVKVFNENFIEYIEKRAISRHKKELELSSDKNNTKLIKEYRILESYIPDYRNLSEITINKDSENIQDKYNIIITLEDMMKYNDINMLFI